jgi:hypothetical protein
MITDQLEPLLEMAQWRAVVEPVRTGLLTL